jgi:3',5'-cyclic AMP phosphodiesterase CpdA
MIAIAALALLQAQTSTPDRILRNVTEDLSRSASYTWRTASKEATIGQIALADADPRFAASAANVEGSSQALTVSEGKQMFHHKVEFGDLIPDTLYAARLGNGKTWSEWIHFRTAKDEPAPFSFIYFGDAQNSLKSLWSRTIRKAFKDEPYADLMIHAGDLVNIGKSDSEWGEWFYAGGWAHSEIPAAAIPGNHEYGGGKLTPLWRPHLDMPENGLKGLEETCWYFDFQGARFIGLNSNERIEDQTVWLKAILEKTKTRWIFVTFHHPTFSTATGRDNKKLRELWQPLFQKHNVAIVLQGHDHTYGRQNVPTGVGSIDAGTVYVVSVSGPKMYGISPEARKTMQKVGQNKQLYQIVKVSHDKVRYESRLVTGELFDSFELTKNADGTNRFSAN